MAIRKPEPEDWLRANIQELRLSDREILEMLRDAKKRVEQILKELPKDKQQIRRAQLENSRAKLMAAQADVFERLGDIVQARRARAAGRAARLSAAADAALLDLVGRGEQGQFLYDRALDVSQRAIDISLVRMKLSALPLSQRIYRSRVWMDGRLGKLINATMAAGLNAAEFAKAARDWFNPNTPGGIRYAAMRLARTEINNAFHAASAQKYATTPWINQVEWNLSKSHPEPDECDILAKQSPFPAESVPARPHPQCLCFITPVSVDEDEFVENFLNGDYDDYLDGELRRNGWDTAPTQMPPASLQAVARNEQPEERVRVSAPVQGKDLRGQLDYDAIGAKNRGDKLRQTGFDEQLPEILKQQGFDGLPQVVNSDRMDALLRDGDIVEVWRAVTRNGDRSAEEINEQMRSGELHAGSGGYGNGIYFAPNKGSAEAYASQDPDNSDILRGAFRRNVKIINYFQLVDGMKRESPGYRKDTERHKLRLKAMKSGPAGDEARQQMEQLISSMTPEEIVLSDEGRFAAAKGYDVISVGFDPDPFTGVQEYVVLNRTALIIEEAR